MRCLSSCAYSLVRIVLPSCTCGVPVPGNGAGIRFPYYAGYFSMYAGYFLYIFVLTGATTSFSLAQASSSSSTAPSSKVSRTHSPPATPCAPPRPRPAFPCNILEGDEGIPLYGFFVVLLVNTWHAENPPSSTVFPRSRSSPYLVMLEGAEGVAL